MQGCTSPTRSSQSLVALLLLFTVFGTFGALILAARSKSLERMLFAREYERFKEDREHFMNRGLCAEFEDRLLLKVLPNTDATRSGVFFFGTSSMKWALEPPECLGPLRDHIHNYSIGATNHTMQAEFVRYLVERQGMLAARPDDVHVVLGLYWSMGLPAEPSRYWEPLWRRYGVYDRDPVRGIINVPLPYWRRSLRFARGEVASFLTGMANRAAREASIAMGVPISTTEKIRDARRIQAIAEKTAGRRGSDKELGRQLADLADLIGYLQERNIGVTCILLPHRAPLREMSLPKLYFARVREVCCSANATFCDWSEMLFEDEFWDINHSNFRGLRKTSRALLEIAAAQLHGRSVEPALASGGFN